MSYITRLEPHVTAMVNELPTPTLRLEMAEAVAWANSWETWRQSQSPPPADTQANRVDYARRIWAKQINNQARQWLGEYRRRGDDEQSEMD